MSAACDFPGLISKDGVIAPGSHSLDMGHLQCVYLLLKAKHSMTSLQHMKVSQALRALQNQPAARLPQVGKAAGAACCNMCRLSRVLSQSQRLDASCIAGSLHIDIRSAHV